MGQRPQTLRVLHPPMRIIAVAPTPRRLSFACRRRSWNSRPTQRSFSSMTWPCAPLDPWFCRANPVPDPNEMRFPAKLGAWRLQWPSAQPATGYRAGFFAAQCWAHSPSLLAANGAIFEQYRSGTDTHAPPGYSQLIATQVAKLGELCTHGVVPGGPSVVGTGSIPHDSPLLSTRQCQITSPHIVVGGTGFGERRTHEPVVDLTVSDASLMSAPRVIPQAAPAFGIRARVPHIPVSALHTRGGLQNEPAGHIGRLGIGIGHFAVRAPTAFGSPQWPAGHAIVFHERAHRVDLAQQRVGARGRTSLMRASAASKSL